MSWEKPGGGKDKDPWKDNKRRGNNEDGPPEIDEALRRLKDRVGGIFGGGRGGSSSGSGFGLFGIGFIILVIVAIWAISGFFVVGPAEKAVVLKFGKYSRMEGPGMHWLPRFIESRYMVNVQRIDNFQYQHSMLTEDENIVNVGVAIQYRVAEPQKYLFEVTNPQISLQEATVSALRQVVGDTTLDKLLTTGRAVVADSVHQLLDKILAQYHTGIAIQEVTLQFAKAPSEVEDAFDDVIKAQEDEQRYINQAESYARGKIPLAQGQAKRMIAEANAYKERVTLEAQGAAAQYLALLPEYNKAPEVTRERLYLSTLQSIMANSSKVLVDVPGGNNMLYLPLDKIFAQKHQHKDVSSSKVTTTVPELPTVIDNTLASNTDKNARGGSNSRISRYSRGTGSNNTLFGRS